MSDFNSFCLVPEEKFNKIFELINSLKEAIENEKVKNSKKLSDTWLDNPEVMKLLRVSPRTLQSMRDNGTLAYSKVGAKIYYKASDVDMLLQSNYYE